MVERGRTAGTVILFGFAYLGLLILACLFWLTKLPSWLFNRSLIVAWLLLRYWLRCCCVVVASALRLRYVNLLLTAAKAGKMGAF